MLRDLEIRNLRIIEHAALSCDPRRNLITGDNGSGKTTVLEAVALTATGRSFRTRAGVPLIRFGSDEAVLKARFALPSQAMEERSLRCRARERELRSEGEPIAAQDAARAIPILVLTPDTIAGVAQSAQDRRRFWFWLMFHVEPQFGPLWSRYRRTLAQRNQALLHGPSALAAWDDALVETGETLVAQFRGVFERWVEASARFARSLGVGPLEMGMHPGFEGARFRDALAAHRNEDRARGFTGVGPHRADLILRLKGRPLAAYASQGQIKLTAVALVAAQAELIQEHHGALIGAIDDLPAALDTRHAQDVWALLQEVSGQWFATTQTAPGADGWGRRFHVEQGRLTGVE
ncbi:MAG: DNA replication/repair protein RecF [Acidiferrobacteraceae bacterium]